MRRVYQTLCQQSNIKSEMGCVHIHRFLFFGKQVKEKRANACFANRTSHELVARTLTATARTMSKQDDTLSVRRNVQIAAKLRRARTNLNIFHLRGRRFSSLSHFGISFYLSHLFFDEDFFFGTFPPSLRASDNPMAIACFLLVTFLPERPLFSVPSLRSCIAFLTFFCAFFPYLAIPHLISYFRIEKR